MQRGPAGIFSLRSCLAPFFLALLAHSELSVAITLDAAERELLRANPDIAIAETGIEGARASVAIAGAMPNPTLNMQTTQYSPVGGLGSGPIYDKALDTIVGISVPIERGDKAALRREAAGELLAGARHDSADARRQQRLALHQSYYDLKLAEDRLALARETRELAEQALRAAERRVAAGDLAAVDRYRLQVDALRSANDVTAAAADTTQARIALAALLGRARPRTGAEGPPPNEVVESGEDPLTAADPWPAVTEELRIDEALAAATARADVAGADARLAAADAARAVARSLRTRDVTVGAQVERVPASAAGLAFGIIVSVPLFARYGFEGEIAKAESDYSSAILTRRKVLAQAEAEIRKAHASLEGARVRLRSYEADILPSAKQALDAVEFAYARGAAPLTDVLDARRTWRVTQGELAQARADHAKARAAWRAATEWERVR